MPIIDLDTSRGSDGMTMLDWFAGQAMVGELSAQGRCGVNVCVSENDRARLVQGCYDIAAAMVAEKRRREEGQ